MLIALLIIKPKQIYKLNKNKTLKQIKLKLTALIWCDRWSFIEIKLFLTVWICSWLPWCRCWNLPYLCSCMQYGGPNSFTISPFKLCMEKLCALTSFAFIWHKRNFYFISLPLLVILSTNTRKWNKVTISKYSVQGPFPFSSFFCCLALEELEETVSSSSLYLPCSKQYSKHIIGSQQYMLNEWTNEYELWWKEVMV